MQNSCSGSSVPLFLPLCVLVSHRYNGKHTYCMRLKDSLHIKQSPQCLVDRKTCRLPTTIIVIVITNFMAVINAAHYIFSALCFLSPLGLGGAIWIVLASELWADVHMCYWWHANCQAYIHPQSSLTLGWRKVMFEMVAIPSSWKGALWIHNEQVARGKKKNPKSLVLSTEIWRICYHSTTWTIWLILLTLVYNVLSLPIYN